MDERIKLKLLQLIYDTIFQDKTIDEEFVSQVIEIVTKERHLEEYLKELIIVKKSEKIITGFTAATYDYYRKTLTINLYTIIDFVQSLADYNLFQNKEQRLYLYIFITQIILHELEHTKQLRQEIENKDDIETFILKNANSIIRVPTDYWNYMSEGGLMEYLRRGKELYKKYYIYSPQEKLAEHYSHLMMTQILEELKDLVPNLYFYELSKLYDNYLLGYHNTPSPTKFYLEKIGRHSIATFMREKVQLNFI